MGYSLRQNPAYSGNYTKGREGNKVNKIVIHHAATTSFDGIGQTFQKHGQYTSAHYGVGRNNNVDQYVKESDIAWHAGNWAANCTSVGIENVNSSGAPDWGIDNKTVDTLVELVYDIAKRNGLLPLKVGSNLFGHHDFYATACPGKLYAKLGTIANRVNKMSGSVAVSTPSSHSSKPDQILSIGSNVKLKGTYRVDALAQVGGIWQVRTNALCRSGFTWVDNGVPVAPLTEVASGKATRDQVLAVGSYYKVGGTFKVVNMGQYAGRWLAQINMGGWRLWVDVEPLTEV